MSGAELVAVIMLVVVAVACPLSFWMERREREAKARDARSRDDLA